ncbi:hypothetical protein V6N11_047838 [Hibiscus sabdariffa]|uniref:Uncharacterized protein n=2 Tax=Hibiscus sabdariffa TaxID=183260 RepID=A0ABR2B626_9ROSI
MKGVTSRHTTWVEVVINNGMHREYGDNHSVQVLDMDSGAVRPDPPSLDPFLTSEHNASVLDLGVDSNSWRQSFIAVSWKRLAENIETMMANVYAPFVEADQEVLWGESILVPIRRTNFS